MSSETIAALVVGAIITWTTQEAKKRGLSSRLTLAALVLTAALIYTLYDTFIDPQTKSQITLFATSTLGSAVFFYEYIVRFSQKKEETQKID